MRCKICQNEFVPSKYRPKQQVCSQPECQKLRQLQNLRNWRNRNPDYFKTLDQDASWKKSRDHYSRFWKASHKEHLLEYTKNHHNQRKEYMRGYMRRYRQASAVNGNKS